MAKATPSRSKRTAGTKEARVVAAPSSSHERISIRKIANGFLVTHCVSGPRGEYHETETFTPKKPNINLGLKKGR